MGCQFSLLGSINHSTLAKLEQQAAVQPTSYLLSSMLTQFDGATSSNRIGFDFRSRASLD